MFTGIVTALGGVEAVERTNGLVRLAIGAPYEAAGVEIGASIAHDGVCLTVVEKAEAGAGVRYVVEAAPETLAITTAGAWNVGDQVNLERALKLGDELGGHIVQGHVDATGSVRELARRGRDVRLVLECPAEVAAQLVPKGSVAIDGVSLTVVNVEAEGFDVALIPHTLEVTTLGRLAPGRRVNLEADVLGKYVKRYVDRILAARQD